MQLGLIGTACTKVTQKNTAAGIGSGALPVFGTPSLIALMEEASVLAVEAVLQPGQTTVGTRVDVAHTAPTPLGRAVQARATLTNIDGRKLTFQVEAFDEQGEIGRGTHERAVVDACRFQEKADAR